MLVLALVALLTGVAHAEPHPERDIRLTLAAAYVGVGVAAAGTGLVVLGHAVDKPISVQGGAQLLRPASTLVTGGALGAAVQIADRGVPMTVVPGYVAGGLNGCGVVLALVGLVAKKPGVAIARDVFMVSSLVAGSTQLVVDEVALVRHRDRIREGGVALGFSAELRPGGVGLRVGGAF